MNRHHLIPSRRNDTVSSFFGHLPDLFEHFERDFFPQSMTEDMNNFMPKIEVKNNEKNYVVSAELPGIKENDINVSLEENTLIIQGEKKSESKQEDKGRVHSEFRYGSFYRAIPLEGDVDNTNVDATYRDGILNITLNKRADGPSRTKKIEINRTGSKASH